MPEFYHVDRVRGRLKAGQVIGLMYDKSATTDKTNRAASYLSMFSDGVTYHGWEYEILSNVVDRDLTGGAYRWGLREQRVITWFL